MPIRVRKNKAQSIAEYALLIAAISAAVVGMSIYFQRTVNSNIASLEGRYKLKGQCSSDPCSGYPCADAGRCCNRASPNYEADPCLDNACSNAGRCCNQSSPNYSSDPCVADPCAGAGNCCNPASPYYNATACCTSDPCTDNPCSGAGRCCNQASSYYNNDPCAADHCVGGACCNDVCNGNACAPAPYAWCQNGRRCGTNPCLSWERNTSYCASECSTCKSNCDNKVHSECLAGCDSDKLLICNNVVYSQCVGEGRTACGYSAQNTYCCNSCGTCAQRDGFSQLRQGNLMLAGGVAAQVSSNGSFILAEDLPSEGDVCYKDCMANVNNCVTNYANSCMYRCTGFNTSNGITLSGCSGNSSKSGVLSDCLNDYAYGFYGGICGVNPPTERSCCAQRCTYGLVGIGIERVEVCYGDECGHSYGWLSSH